VTAATQATLDLTQRRASAARRSRLRIVRWRQAANLEFAALMSAAAQRPDGHGARRAALVLEACKVAGVSAAWAVPAAAVAFMLPAHVRAVDDMHSWQTVALCAAEQWLTERKCPEAERFRRHAWGMLGGEPGTLEIRA